jgi:methanogenic corrinoid protein MtbC1
MSREEICQKVVSLHDASAVQERIVNELVNHMAGLNMEKFEEIIDRYIHEHGMKLTMREIIFPFLNKIGILWQSGYIHPAQEHLVSNMVRQKVLVAIDKIQPKEKVNKTFLLFLPEGEQHELALLFVYYLLRERGINVLYLGANVPLADVQKVMDIKRPDILFTHLTAPAAGFTLDKFLKQASHLLDSSLLVLSGSLIQNYSKKLPASMEIKATLQDVEDYLSTV